MKTLFLATMLSVGLFSASQAATVKVEFDTVNPSTSRIDGTTFKGEYTDKLIGNLNYSVELAASRNNGSGALTSDQVVGKVSTSFPVAFVTVTPRVELGENFSAGNSGQTFWGVEGTVTSKTPIEGLSVTSGYRYRNNLSSNGLNTSRFEASGAYQLTEQYSVGGVYYRTAGDSHNNTLGVFVKSNF